MKTIIAKTFVDGIDVGETEIETAADAVDKEAYLEYIEQQLFDTFMENCQINFEYDIEEEESK